MSRNQGTSFSANEWSNNMRTPLVSAIVCTKVKTKESHIGGHSRGQIQTMCLKDAQRAPRTLCTANSPLPVLDAVAKNYTNEGDPFAALK